MLKIALTGNPNSGKTTLFNALTGSTARVGNWPGVTVDKKEGFCEADGQTVNVIDLPGLYSLAPYSPEERVARDFLLQEQPHCIIHVVDATNLERSLYLTTQLLELDVPVVVALNMTDVLDANGDVLNVRELEQRLNVPVVEISALKRSNIPALISRAVQTAKTPRNGRCILQDCVLFSAIAYAETLLKARNAKMPTFHAVKLVEGDILSQKIYPEEARKVQAFIREKHGAVDEEAVIADARYQYVTARLSSLLQRAKPMDGGYKTKSDKADVWLTHKFWGIPIFLCMLFLIFHVVFSGDFLFLGKLIPAFGHWCAKEGDTVKNIFFGQGLNALGVILYNTITLVTDFLASGLVAGLRALGANAFWTGLLGEGVVGGLFSVLCFLPQMLLLFLLFSVLEDSGYMARVAFILDKIFRPFGVSGKAFMPMIMGLGCSVPAIMNTRTLATEKERIATVRVIPFFPCGAKMPVLLTVAGAIARWSGTGSADIIVGCVYLLCVIIAMLSLLVMHALSDGKDRAPFLMELPSYRMPDGKSIGVLLWDKAKHFLQRAFTVIVLSSVVVWLLTNVSWDWEHVGGRTEGLGDSVLASIGTFLSPLFVPLGFGGGRYGWVFVVATFTGLIAKENILATLGALAGGLCGVEGIGGENAVLALFSLSEMPVSACLAFIAFNILTVPCLATLATARGELSGTAFTNSVWFWLGVSYAVSALVYTVGITLWAWLGWLASAGLVGLAVWGIKSVRKKKKPPLGGCDGACARCEGKNCGL